MQQDAIVGSQAMSSVLTPCYNSVGEDLGMRILCV